MAFLDVSYYPFGLVHSGIASPVTAPENKYKYQGLYAEEISETGWNQFELRMWDGRIGRWMTTDPYNQFHSPYLGMGNNPINGVDPDGGFFAPPSTEVRDNGDGTYTVVGGDSTDGDLGIYVVDVNGERTGEMIGYSLTMSSFFNHEKDQHGWHGVINLCDQSGFNFMRDYVYSGDVGFKEYFTNAGRGEDYDFKRIGQPEDEWDERPYQYRGMEIYIESSNKFVIASARDVGNYSAGYIYGKTGAPWSVVRNSFDLKESAESPYLPRREQLGSRLAQKVGWRDGWNWYIDTNYRKLIMFDF